MVLQLVQNFKHQNVEIVQVLWKLLIRHVCSFFFVEIQIPSHLGCINVKHTMTESPTTAHCHFIKTCTRTSKPSTNKSCLSQLLQNTILDVRVQVLMKWQGLLFRYPKMHASNSSITRLLFDFVRLKIIIYWVYTCLFCLFV